MRVEVVTNRRDRRLLWMRRFFFSVPEKWADLSPRRKRQWWQWALLFPPDEATTRMAAQCAPWYLRRLLPPDEIAQISTALAWASPVVDNELVFPYTRLRCSLFASAKEKGENMSCLEFAVCDDLYNTYIEKQHPEKANLLSHIVYRPVDNDKQAGISRGDTRVPFRGQSEAQYQLAYYGPLPDHIVGHAMVYFSGVKRFVHDTYGSWIFQPAASAQDDGPNYGWWGIFQAVAESGVFGTIEQVYQASIHEVCVFLVRKRYEAQKTEEMHNSALKKNSNTYDDIY